MDVRARQMQWSCLVSIMALNHGYYLDFVYVCVCVMYVWKRSQGQYSALASLTVLKGSSFPGITVQLKTP